MSARLPELLAPAGGREAGYAALHHGADAIFVGLPQFSARAEATNVTPAELEELVAYAHQLAPPRRVYVTLNTLVLEAELPQVLAALQAIVTAQADAVIVQDLGVVRLAQQYFPRLRLHASTQLAAHHAAAVATLRDLGFARVTLARELTLAEIRACAAVPGIEVEAFIHGTLCYCYSGLCLMSSLSLGRSGNRGRCAYHCRDTFRAAAASAPAATPGAAANPGAHLCSMKDLAAGDDLPGLCQAGVASLKIEGRKKSPLYVAAVTQYYRELLAGDLRDPAERAAREAELHTIFSRPWTSLFLRSRRATDVVDANFVGHRGAPIGQVAAVRRSAGRAAALRFRTTQALERHDGLQIEVTGQAMPVGFPVDVLRVEEPGQGVRPAFTAPAGAWVEVELPPGYPPVPVGATVFHSSSQASKRAYEFPLPKPGACRRRWPIAVEVTLSAAQVVATATLPAVTGEPWTHVPLQMQHTAAGPFAPARNATDTAAAVSQACGKLGDTPFTLAQVTCHNPDGVFVPVSLLNQVRRALVSDLATAAEAQRAAWLHARQAELAAPPVMTTLPRPTPPQWTLKVQQLDWLADFAAEDWAAVGELIVCLPPPATPIADFLRARDQVALHLEPARPRLALPVITREWEAAELRARVAALRAAGWQRWELANIAAWSWLEVAPNAAAVTAAGLDLTGDWPLYAMNHAAAARWLAMGLQRVTLSPEDGRDNLTALLRRLGPQAAVPMYLYPPLFIAEACLFATAQGHCPGPVACRAERLTLVTGHGESVTAVRDHCRTVVIGAEPLCWAGQLPELGAAGAIHLRAEFAHHAYTPATVRALWRRLRAGQAPPGQLGNYHRGLQ